MESGTIAFTWRNTINHYHPTPHTQESSDVSSSSRKPLAVAIKYCYICFLSSEISGNRQIPFPTLYTNATRCIQMEEGSEYPALWRNPNASFHASLFFGIFKSGHAERSLSMPSMGLNESGEILTKL